MGENESTSGLSACSYSAWAVQSISADRQAIDVIARKSWRTLFYNPCRHVPRGFGLGPNNVKSPYSLLLQAIGVSEPRFALPMIRRLFGLRKEVYYSTVSRLPPRT